MSMPRCARRSRRCAPRPRRSKSSVSRVADSRLPTTALPGLPLVAMEGMGEGGRKLMIAVKSWRLARALGFKEARVWLRPAVEYLTSGPRDRTAFEGILAALGKEWVDLDALASGGRPLDSEGRSKLAQVASAPDPSSCIARTLALLREGYAAVSVAEGFAIQAASRAVAAKGYDLEAARSAMFAH